MTAPVKELRFQLLRIETKQFALIEESYEQGGTIEMSLGFNYGIVKEKRTILMLTDVQFESNKKTFIKLEAGLHFELELIGWEKLLQDNGVVVVPKGFMHHMAMLSLGTARGILHAKTEGSPFNKYLIPSVNVTEFIKEDVTFQ